VNRPYQNGKRRLTPIAEAVRVNLPYQSAEILDMISKCRAYCVNDSITQRTLPGALARSISSRFAVSNGDQTSSKVLFHTARIYHERGRWNLNLLLLMPDHLHGLIGVDGRDSLSQLVRDYKRITAKMAGVQWQRNFFDHRLRHDESLAEKFAYICQNPMRAGLVHNEQDWPYVFIPGRPNASSW